ncbi:cadherin-like beta sandwich domain-containing protein [Lachnospiraceae bacterium LCP19S3_B12]
MTGKRKRIWAILLSILMVLQLSSATVFAETQNPDVQGIQTESAVLSEGTVDGRTSSTATVTVNANMDGTVYFTALAAEVEAPDATAIEAAGNLSFMVSAGANTLTLPGLSEAALKVYMVLKGLNGEVSEVYSMDLPAVELSELKTVPEDVTIRFEMNDGTLISKTDMSGKSVKTLGALGVTGGIENAEPEYVTPLHLLAQAMVERNIPVDIQVKENGWVLECNGTGADLMYYVNGADSSATFGGYEVKPGDNITVIQCSFEGGVYTGFGYFGEVVDNTFDPIDMMEEAEVAVKEPLTLQYSYKGWSSGNDVAVGADVFISGKNGYAADQKTEITTDSEGKFTVSFDEPGVYLVSARAYIEAGNEESGRLASNAYCKVTVTDAAAGPELAQGEPPVSERTAGSAKITVNASTAGSLYYLVQEAGAAAPDAARLESEGQTAAAVQGENTLELTGLDKSAQKIYLLLKSGEGTVSPVICVDIPEAEEPLLKGILSNGGNPEFDGSREAAVTWETGDIQFRLKPVFPDGMSDVTLSFRYTGTDGQEKVTEPTTKTNTYFWFDEDFLSIGGQGNDLTIIAEKDTVTQTYVVHVQRTAYLTGLTVQDQKGNPIAISPSFSKTKTEYSAVVLDNVDQIELKATDPVEAVSPEASRVLFNGEASEDGSWTMNLKDGENQVVFQADNGAAAAQEYSLTITRTASVTLTVQTSPEDAAFSLYRGAKGIERIWPEEDGTYKLFPDEAYQYTVAKSGYIGQSGEVTLSADETKTFALEKAPETEPLPQLDADYPGFRAGDDNQSVVSSKTPITKETIEVKWERQTGDYVSPTSGTTPIIVDDKVYTISKGVVYMLDKETGEVLKTGSAVQASAGFNLLPPTYADGMLFVLLDNGVIQCFNASTLESLWVYRDPLGGGCNSSIRYDDGYIYLGFQGYSGSNFVCLSVTDEDPSSTTEEKVAVWRNSGLGETFQWNGAWTNEEYVFVTTTNARKTNGTLCCVDKITGKAVQKIELGESVRSDVSYYNGRIYFTTQSGNLYSYNLTKEGILDTENLIEPLYFGGASTSTPAVYNNRVYIGYSGGESFGAEGYGILVGSIDPDTGAMSAAYVVPTDGYPQTSGLITKGYEEETGYVYVYFLTNSAHGTLYMIKDKAGMTEADPASGVFYTPNHEQYCIASAVADSDGNIYMKNDSAWQFVITRSETYLKEIQATGGNAVLDGGKDFNGSLRDHTITVDAGTESINLKLTPSDGAEVRINGTAGSTQEIALTDGRAEIQVQLTKGDSYRVYNFTVLSGPTLTSLTVTNNPNEGMGTAFTVSPEFEPMSTDYTAGIATVQSSGYIWFGQLNASDMLKAVAVSGVSGKNEGDELKVTTNYKGNKYISVSFEDRTNAATAVVQLIVSSADGSQTRSYTVTLNTKVQLTLAEGAVTNRKSSSADLTVSAGQAGELYYLVQAADAEAPDADRIQSEGLKTEAAAGSNRLALTGLSRDAMKVYMVLKTENDGVSAVCSADIPTSVMLGDLNEDGEVDITDVVQLLDRVAAGEAVELSIGDMNGDGEVDITDVVQLLDQVAAGGK